MLIANLYSHTRPQAYTSTPLEMCGKQTYVKFAWLVLDWIAQLLIRYTILQYYCVYLTCVYLLVPALLKHGEVQNRCYEYTVPWLLWMYGYDNGY